MKIAYAIPVICLRKAWNVTVINIPGFLFAIILSHIGTALMPSHLPSAKPQSRTKDYGKNQVNTARIAVQK